MYPIHLDRQLSRNFPSLSAILTIMVAVKLLQPEGKGVRAELTFKVRTHYFRSESVAEDALSAVEQAIDRLEGHIRKYKSRMKKRVKDYSYMQAFLDAEEQTPPSEVDEAPREEFNIIRRKSFPISAMTPDEAICRWNFRSRF